jgi:predicted esterase YcpF (UPF0227 family)
MLQADVLELGPRDRLLAGVQLAGFVATWLIMLVPMCLLALASVLFSALARRT